MRILALTGAFIVIYALGNYLTFNNVNVALAAPQVQSQAIITLLVNADTIYGSGVQSKLGVVKVLNPSRNRPAAIRKVTIFDPVTGTAIPGVTLPFTLPLRLPPLGHISFSSADLGGLVLQPLTSLGYPMRIDFVFVAGQKPLQFIVGDSAIDPSNGHEAARMSFTSSS